MKLNQRMKKNESLLILNQIKRMKGRKKLFEKERKKKKKKFKKISKNILCIKLIQLIKICLVENNYIFLF